MFSVCSVIVTIVIYEKRKGNRVHVDVVEYEEHNFITKIHIRVLCIVTPIFKHTFKYLRLQICQQREFYASVVWIIWILRVQHCRDTRPSKMNEIIQHI